MDMPEKDSGLWSEFWLWLSVNAPWLYAMFLSAAIAGMRVIYGGGNGRQMLLEGAMCGAVTLALVPLLEWLGLPQNMATFAGGAVGFMGVEKLRDYADRAISRKVEAE